MTQPISGLIFVGVDLGRKEHMFIALDQQKTIVFRQYVKQDGQELAAASARLIELAGGCPANVRAASECPHGAVSDTLIDFGASVYSINPKQVAAFREARGAAGCKDDERDAYTIARALIDDPDCFRHLSPSCSLHAELRLAERERARLSQEQTAIRNRIANFLSAYYPQFLKMCDFSKEWHSALWKLIPTPERAAGIKLAAVEKLVQKSRARAHTPEEIIGALAANPLALSPGNVNGMVNSIRCEVAILSAVFSSIKAIVRRIKELKTAISDQQIKDATPAGDSGLQAGDAAPAGNSQTAPLSDIQILESMPGAGISVIATLFGEAGEIIRSRDAELLLRFSGAAPVSCQSGAQGRGIPLRVVFRRACNRFLRNALHHWGRVASFNDPYYSAMYAACRARGHTFGRTCRQVAAHLLNLYFVLLRKRQLYDTDVALKRSQRFPASAADAPKPSFSPKPIGAAA